MLASILRLACDVACCGEVPESARSTRSAMSARSAAKSEAKEKEFDTNERDVPVSDFEQALFPRKVF